MDSNMATIILLNHDPDRKKLHILKILWNLQWLKVTYVV